MSLQDKLLKVEGEIRARVERVFGAGAAQTPLELRRAIVEHVEDRIVSRDGKRRFTYNRVEVHLLAAEGEERELLASALVEEDALVQSIRHRLLDSRCETPHDLQVTVDFRAPEDAGRRFRIDYVRTEERPRAATVPEVEFAVLKGAAEQPAYSFKRERIQIGRLREVLDKDGQVVRRNDIVFLDNGDDVNATVGRAHATVLYSPEKDEHRIIDEVSRYGTRIFRQGRSIEVPSGNPRGIRLTPGDEIYLGQACLTFGVGPR
jgi:hypothetical protein